MGQIDFRPYMAFKRAGCAEEARRWLADFLSSQTDANLLSDIGDELRRNGLVDEAIQTLERAVTISPAFAAAWVNYGTALQQMGQIDRAKLTYDRALALEPSIPAVANNLGKLFADENRWPEAAAMFLRAVESEPESPVLRMHLAEALVRVGRRDEAIEAARKAVALDPADSMGAGMFLASLGDEKLPVRAPDALLTRLYANRAQSWDAKPYRGAEMVARAVNALCENDLDVLDIGCGTGLVSALIRPKAKWLEGIDLSAEMLAAAETKGLYDRLSQRDLLVHLSENVSRYDLITAAAVLIHFGDLSGVFDRAFAALRDGGLFIFTAFPNEADRDGVCPGDLSGYARGGCFLHGEYYIRRVAERSGFSVALLNIEAHEFTAGMDAKSGLIVALRR